MRMSFRTLCALVFCTVAGGCGIHGGALRGRLVDAGTQQPIVGAVVYAEWYGSQGGWGHGNSNICFHLSAAVTDAEGNYYMPFWTQKTDSIFDGIRTFDRRTELGFYADGYPAYKFQEMSPNNREPYQLKKEILDSPEDNRRRFEQILKIGNSSCTGLDLESEKNYILLSTATLPEAKRLAGNEDELQRVEWERGRVNYRAQNLNNKNR